MKNFLKMNPLNIKAKKSLIDRIENSKNEWSYRSKKNLETVHQDLQKVFNLALKISDVDFSITEGYRSTERQKKLYERGRTKPGQVVTHIDGIHKVSRHQKREAVDIAAYNKERKITYDKKHLVYIAGVVLACSEILFQTGETESRVEWGGNWDNDGLLFKDHSFVDYPHFQIRK